MDSPYRRELEVATAAVEHAARLAQALLPDPDKGALEKAEKDDNMGPVTVGDFAIQALLTATLHYAFPDDSFVGEEDAGALRANPALRARVWSLVQGVLPTIDADKSGPAHTGDAAVYAGLSALSDEMAMCDAIDRCQGSPLPQGRTWVFDPIDGTKTFLRREMYAINVALLVDGAQTVAVVACPLLSPDDPADGAAVVDNASVDPTGRGSLLFAVAGHGAYVRPLFDGASAARHRSTAEPRKLVRHAAAQTVPPSFSRGGPLRPVTCHALQSSALEDVHRAVAAELGVPYPGSDLLGWVPRWSALALGLANFTVWVYASRRRHAKVWDHAGAMLLFEEVGGIITDVDGKPLDLLAGRTFTNNFGFVAAPADRHAAVLAAVHKALRAQGRFDLLGKN